VRSCFLVGGGGGMGIVKAPHSMMWVWLRMWHLKKLNVKVALNEAWKDGVQRLEVNCRSWRWMMQFSKVEVGCICVCEVEIGCILGAWDSLIMVKAFVVFWSKMYLYVCGKEKIMCYLCFFNGKTTKKKKSF